MSPTQFTRFKDSSGFIRWGIVLKTKVEVIEGTPFKKYRRSGNKKSLKTVKLLSPVSPGKIICVGLNYRDHARELGMDLPREPLVFLKASSSVAGPGSKIVKPKDCRQLDYEAELAAVIGRKGKNIKVSRVLDYILGYTCFNDVTARDIQRRESQWSRAKGYDTFSPAGPYITAGVDPRDLNIKLVLNGNIKQDSSTRNMIFTVPEIVNFISKIMTLYPGDVIATGTPPGVGPMEEGDRVEVEIEKVGKLKNIVGKEK